MESAAILYAAPQPLTTPDTTHDLLRRAVIPSAARHRCQLAVHNLPPERIGERVLRADLFALLRDGP